MRKKRKERREKRRWQHDADAPQDFDRRSMEKSLADMGRLLSEREFESIDEMNAFTQQAIASGELDEVSACTPLEQAQDVMYKTWETSGRHRITLARQALPISKDCADAYALLAEEAAKSLEDAADLYRQGVEAGERALGPQAFKEDVGHFWGIVSTRPYMRARTGLAHALWAPDKREEAIVHIWDMLRLNPNDNQGLRDILMNWLLTVGDDDGAQKLFESYDDGMATWRYSLPLMIFRKEGPSEEASMHLFNAISYNSFVPPYLLGKKRLPKRLPAYMGFGDENEAVHYAVDALEVWQQDREALAWLQKTFEEFEALS